MNKHLIAALLAVALPLGASAGNHDGAPVETELVDSQSGSGAQAADQDDAGVSGKAAEAWEATKEGASSAAKYTYEKADRAWQATKSGTGRAIEWTREKSGQAWEATKDTADKTADTLKRGYDKAKEKTREMVDGE